MRLSLAGEIVNIVELLKDSSIDESSIIKGANENLYLNLKVITKPENKLLERKNTDFKNSNILKLKNLLADKLENNFFFERINNSDDFKTTIELEDKLLVFTLPYKRIDSPSTYIFILWMLSTTTFFILISVIFMRNQIRSIINIAKAARHYGKNQNLGDFKPSGAFEVRQVARSFIEMKSRLEKYIQQRTDFLAGVSHDLKTPLTRIKLHLSILDETDDIKELKSDVIEMEKMIKGYIDFTKNRQNNEILNEEVNLNILLNSVILSYKNSDKEISFKADSQCVIYANSNLLRRVFTNLIDNAIRYADKVEISVNRSGKQLIINIDDDGIGIEKQERENVFKPFYRIDKSRHIESANTGLGLSIAKDIIIGYSGVIKLHNSPLGGLRVTVKLAL